MVELARAYLGERLRRGGRYSVTAGSITSIPHESGTIDKVLIYGVIHYLTPVELERAGEEVFRVLRPGGKAVVGDIPRSGHRRNYLGFKSRRFSFEELAGLFSPRFEVRLIGRSESVMDLCLIKAKGATAQTAGVEPGAKETDAGDDSR
jgi:SAM-dependent methyltransferase